MSDDGTYAFFCASRIGKWFFGSGQTVINSVVLYILFVFTANSEQNITILIVFGARKMA